MLLAIFAGLMPGQFADPFMRNDDFIAHFPLPELAWENTLTEGRWGNLLWTERGISGQRHISFALSMLLWALVCGLIAARLFRNDRAPWRTLIFAFALAAAPQAAQLLFWYNFNTPAHLVLLGGTVFLAKASARAALVGLPVLVFLALATYPSNAFCLLAIALAFGATSRPMSGVLRLLAVFVLSVVASVLIVYAINDVVHGHFGLRLADWRGASQARDLAGLLSNLGRLGIDLTGAAPGGDWFERAALAALLALPALGAIMAVQSRRPAWLRAMLAGAVLSLAMAIGQTLLTGAMLPNRATGFLWVFGVLGLALAARESATETSSRWFSLSALVLGVFGASIWHHAPGPGVVAYQRLTARIAEDVLARPAKPSMLLITGDLNRRPETRVLNEFIGLEFRLKDLTGLEVRYCPAYDASRVRDLQRFHPAARPRLRRHAQGVRLCAPHREALNAIPFAYPEPDAVIDLAPGVLGLQL